MLTSAPLIPQNLIKKLEAAAKRYQREYDHLTLADARRLLARHGFRMPVLGALQFHGNGALKGVSLRENLKRDKPSQWQIGANLTIFESPFSAARELWSPFIRWIVSTQVKKQRQSGWYQTDKLSNGELDNLLQKLPKHDYGAVDVRDASLLMLRMMAELERDARRNESNHQALQRVSRPVPPALLEKMNSEKEDALRWFNERTAKGCPPSLGYGIDFLDQEDQIVLSYRYYHDRN